MVFPRIHDTGFFIHLNNTKSADILCHRYIFAHNGDVRFLLDMIIQYLIIIQFVYTVAACHNNIRFMAALQKINVLCQGIRCSAVPVSVLCRDRRCKNIQATLLTSEIPPLEEFRCSLRNGNYTGSEPQHAGYENCSYCSVQSQWHGIHRLPALQQWLSFGSSLIL